MFSSEQGIGRCTVADVIARLKAADLALRDGTEEPVQVGALAPLLFGPSLSRSAD